MESKDDPPGTSSSSVDIGDGPTIPHERCMKQTDYAMKRNPMVVFLLKALEKQGCPMKRQHILCEPCTIPMGGEFDPKKGVILCENHLSTQNQVTDALSHELIHAFDHCRAFIDWQDCYHHACAEIRAASLSGDCYFIKEFMRGNWNLRKQHQECVKRRTLLSLSMNPNCQDKHEALKVVESVLATCLADTQPFDRIP